MKKMMLLGAAAALLLTACAQQNTRITGVFPEDNDVTTVEMIVGDQLDTVIAVTDGKFQIEVPTDVAALSYVMADGQQIQFVPDGNDVKIDFASGKSTSASKKGVQARLTEFLDWNQTFMSDFQEKMAAASEEESDAIYDEALSQYNDYMEKTIVANSDNVLGLMAISSIELEDDAKMLSLIEGLDERLQADPRVSAMKKSLEASTKTAEGMPFVDFEILQDPEDPASVTRLSDYVGNGKYILVDFWASWCGPCRREMPNLREVYAQFHGDKFDMLSVAVWDKPEDTIEAAAEEQIAWNQIINAQRIPTELYGIQGIPHIILFGPDGTILKRNLRGEAIGAAIAEALGE